MSQLEQRVDRQVERDILEQLLPGAGAAELATARRVTTFLRLLADDARASTSTRVRVDVPGAAREMAQHDRERALGALRDLLRHHLHAALDEDSFLWFGRPGLDHQSAWSRLEELRGEAGEDGAAVPYVPAPGEDPLGVVARLLEHADGVGMEPVELDLWRASRASVAARRSHASDPTGAELARAGERGARAAGHDEVARSFRSLRALERLDRVDPRGALALLDASGAASGAGDAAGDAANPWSEDARMRQVHAWCRCLTTREPDVPGRSPVLHPVAPVPRPLVDLREAWPAVLGLLAGAARDAGQRDHERRTTLDESDVDALLDRRTHGASALLVLRLVAGGTRLVLADLAPGLGVAGRAGAERWAARRETAFTDPREPEHRLVLDAAPVRRWSRGADAPRGTLGERALAIALAPVLDERGDVAGWVHLECEHRLLPTCARLAAIGHAAALRLGARELSAASVDAPVHAETSSNGPAGGAFHALVGGLGMKLQHRRWWGFVVEGGEVVPVASGGGGLAGDASRGGGRAVSRALAAAGVASFDEPDARLALDERAASGIVLPALVRGRVVALLAVESERRRDFRPQDVARLRRGLDEQALRLRLAVFRAWHRRGHRVDVRFPCEDPGFTAFAERLVAAGRSTAPVVLAGPVGSGRRTLARWLHYESTQGREPLVRAAAASAGLAGERVALDPALLDGRGTLLVEGLERLDASGSATLLGALDAWRRTRSGEPARRRIVVVVDDSLAAAAERGALEEPLARRLDRVQLVVRPLCDRREELPGLVRFLARRFAEEEDLPRPELADDALACLWRQPWPGNLPELENTVYKLVLTGGDELLDAAALHTILGAYGLELAPRLPSRHPRRADLVAALRTTRRGTGRPNKTRAAAYLGWDPDTLVARMDDLDIDGQELERGAGWS